MSDPTPATPVPEHALEDAVEFAENPEPRCACVLLLDTSGSMQGEPIAALNEGLKVFHETLLKDPVASRRVEIAVVTFDSAVEVVHDFSNPDAFEPPTLAAEGLTAMGEGVHRALDLIQQRKQAYRSAGLAYYRPWVLMITDGEPQGEDESVTRAAAERVRHDEAAKRVAFFAVGVENANLEKLKEMSSRQPLKLKGLAFQELFVWLSSSMSSVSQARPDEQAPLPPVGWAAV